MNLIKNHKSLGNHIEYEDSKTGRKTEGIVTGVQRGNPLRDIETGKLIKNTFKLRIKPDTGGRAFWTTTMRSCP